MSIDIAPFSGNGGGGERTIRYTENLNNSFATGDINQGGRQFQLDNADDVKGRFFAGQAVLIAQMTGTYRGRLMLNRILSVQDKYVELQIPANYAYGDSAEAGSLAQMVNASEYTKLTTLSGGILQQSASYDSTTGKGGVAFAVVRGQVDFQIGSAVDVDQLLFIECDYLSNSGNWSVGDNSGTFVGSNVIIRARKVVLGDDLLTNSVTLTGCEIGFGIGGDAIIGTENPGQVQACETVISGANTISPLTAIIPVEGGHSWCNAEEIQFI
jgi:hypothetical protein